MENKKILGLIGLAARARKICFGADSVKEQINKNKIKLLIIAQDASQRTKTKFETLAKEKNIKSIVMSNIDELSKTIGKQNKAIIGIEDINFAREIEKIYYGGDVIG